MILIVCIMRQSTEILLLHTKQAFALLPVSIIHSRFVSHFICRFVMFYNQTLYMYFLMLDGSTSYVHNGFQQLSRSL